MKKSVLLFLILLFGVVPFAKGAEPETVLMNIDGKEVMMSEFEYFLNKNSKKSLKNDKKINGHKRKINILTLF